jgi:serine/threonine protein kinase
LTGRLPFVADSHTALAVKHIKNAPPHVSDLNPRVPDQLDQIVDKVLSKEPSGRYRTAEQLGRVLNSYRLNSVEETGPVEAITPNNLEVEELVTAAHVIDRQVTEPPQATPKDENKAGSNLVDGGQPDLAADLYLPVPEEGLAIDRTAVVLAIIALVSLLGLIPLWYLVFQQYTS